MALFRTTGSLLIAGVLLLASAGDDGGETKMLQTVSRPKAIQLPPPQLKGQMPVEQALAKRRSVREFKTTALTEQELSQLLWAAQGITSRDGLRTAPSAGALYPLELYVAVEQALYHYDPRKHVLEPRLAGDLRPALFRTALEQEAVRDAPAVFVFAAVYERISRKYGAARSPRYVHMEVGHAAQNLLLEAVALGLGGVPVGAFDDPKVQKALGLPPEEKPVYLVPVGHPR